MESEAETTALALPLPLPELPGALGGAPHDWFDFDPCASPEDAFEADDLARSREVCVDVRCEVPELPIVTVLLRSERHCPTRFRRAKDLAMFLIGSGCDEGRVVRAKDVCAVSQDDKKKIGRTGQLWERKQSSSCQYSPAVTNTMERV